MKKALIIDDSHIAQMYLKRILEKLGFEVVTATNGLQGLETLKTIAKDLSIIMVDWQMPRMDGHEFINIVRTNSHYHHIPIMMVTTENDAHHMVKAMDAGANEYIIKPYTQDIIEDKLKYLRVNYRIENQTINRKNNDDLSYIRDFIYKASALVLNEDKDYLIRSRLTSVVEQRGFANLQELISTMRNRPDAKLNQQVLDALLTNETSFFRDQHPFETLKKHIIPELIEKRKHVKKLNIWSAACSSGQEPYSLAILIREHFPELANWSINILATDLSTEMLDIAKKGNYNQHSVNRGLPTSLLLKYFEQQADSSWTVRSNIKKMITFKSLNLIESWPFLPAMDIVFMRNVLIYFNEETKQNILKKAHAKLNSDSYLFLGSTENTARLMDEFCTTTLDRTCFYQAKNSFQKSALPTLSSPSAA